MRRGDLLEVTNRSDAKWWLATRLNRGSSSGYVPVTLLEELPARFFQDAQEQDDIVDI